MKIVHLFFALFLTHALMAQNPNAQLQKIAEQLTDFSALPQEKVFCRFDKPFYATGETVFFKAFVADAATHRNQVVSRILHIEACRVGDSVVVAHHQFSIGEDGTAFGSLDTKTWPSSAYVIRAYTYWMRNLPTEFCFQQVISVTNSVDNKPPTALEDAAKTGNFALKFFPEGGNCVAGLENRVAFKAIDKTTGKGVDVGGVIVEEADKGVTAFKTSQFGIGSFAFTPQIGKSYKAVIEAPNGSKWVFPLPDAQAKGFVFSANGLVKEGFIRLRIATNLANNELPPRLFVVGHQRGKVGFGTEITLDPKSTKSFVLEVPKANFTDEGIVHFTLFDDKATPLCERLVFVENAKRRLSIRLKTNKNQYAPREKVELSVETRDVEGKPIAADLSLAVINNDKISTPQYQEHLLSYLNMSSDLGGFIESPAYYFSDTSRRVRLAIDQLLMTHGWRRFAWKDVLSRRMEDMMTPQYMPEFGLPISGTLKDGKKRVKNADLLVSIIEKTGETQSLFSKTDAEGSFRLDNVVFNDSARILLNVVDREKPFDLEPKTTVWQASPAFKGDIIVDISPKIMEYVAAAKDELALLNERERVILPALEVTSQKKIVRDTRLIVGSGKESIKVEIDASSAGTSSNIVEYLCTRLGIRCANDKNMNPYFLPLRARSSIEGSSQPLLLMDGMPVEMEIYRSISVNDVENVEVIRGSALAYGTRGANGMINILLKNSSPNKKQIKTTFTSTAQTPSFMVKGYDLVKQFYSPDYAEKNANQDKPDYRSTIYWSSLLKTDATGKTTVIFYNSDEAATVRLMSDGRQADGKAGFSEVTYKVEKQ